MTKQELFDYCREEFDTLPDYPFEGDYAEAAVFRHPDNRKWFALCMRVPRNKFGFSCGEVVEVVNLKLPSEMFGTFGREDGVYPAYHMNKVHWISVLLPDADEETVRFLVNASFDATKSKPRRKASC